jgi:hypothetical protein
MVSKIKGIKGLPKKKKVTTVSQKGKTNNAPRTWTRGAEDQMKHEELVAYVKLLSDPCNGKFVSPPFAGTGTNQFMRTKTFLTLPPGTVDAVVQFAPAYITSNSGPYNTLARPSPILYSATGTYGGAMNTIFSQAISPNVFGSYDGVVVTKGLAGSARCVAACMKVHYVGTELNRKGLISATVGPGVLFSGNSPSGGAAIDTAPSISSEMPQTDRFGSRVHEYRWLPDADDQTMQPLSGAAFQSGGITTYAGDYSGNSLIVACTNTNADSIYIEIVSCWEYELNLALGSGLQRAVSTPPRGTLNEALRMLGNVGKWALEPNGQAAISAFSPAAAAGVRAVGAFVNNFG